MTVSTEVNQAAYTGNGVTTVFPYTFRILNASNLTVTRIDLQEVETVLTLGTDYTVTGAGSYNGGAVTLPQPLLNGYSLVIERDLAIVQETDLRNQGTFFAEVHEDAFDYLTMIIQQVASWIGLALRRPTIKSKFYDAKQYRIANLADPINSQDAVNNQTLLKSLADLSTDGSGQFVLQMLANQAPGLGASLVNTTYNQTVENLLTSIKRSDGFYFSTFTGAKTYNIPSDYPNMQAAVDDLHIQTTTHGYHIILNLEAGYQEKYGLKVQHGDFSRFYIKSATGTVQVADDFIGVVGPDGGSTITSGTVIMAYHAKGPVLGCIFDGRQIARTLYFALGGSHGWADRLQSSSEETPNPVKISGGTNFRHATFEAQEGSVIVCENVVATGCLLNSIYCERNSIIHAEFSDASGSVQAGVMATRSSRVNADSMNVSGCKFGMWASRGATISAADANADTCTVYGFYADMAATINAHNTSALNAGTGIPADTTNLVNPGASYHAYRGSKINATTGKASGSLYAVSAVIDSDVSAFGLVANQTKTVGVTARYSSRVSVDNCTITGTIGRGILAADASTISANTGNIQGGTTVVGASTGGDVVVSLGQVKGGVTGCYAETGGKITATGATVTGNSTVDLRINTGSMITANGATYGTANTATNAVTTLGIIFN
ncbi:MAG: hypothetical protein ACREXO_00030 [Advenella sp.]